MRRWDLPHAMLISLFMMLPSSGWTAPYTLDLAHTSAYFAVSHYDRSMVRGRFNKMTGSVDFDEPTQQGQVDIVVDTTSLDTGLRLLDTILKSAQFLEVEQFGEMRFQSKQFEWQDTQLVAVTGVLTLRGISKTVRLQATRFSCGAVRLFAVTKRVCGGDFYTEILRSDFGMTRFLPEVGDKVQLTIAVEASPQ